MREREFLKWLEFELPAGILAHQVPATRHILDRLPAADLLTVVLEGDDKMAMEAVKHLRVAFQRFEYWMEQMETARSEADHEAWN